MPELPEVEHLRRSIEPALLGVELTSVLVARRSVIDHPDRDLDSPLLVGGTISSIHRRGKQLALETKDGRVLVVQLGMTGSLTIEHEAPPEGVESRHRHVVWTLKTPAKGSTATGSTMRGSSQLIPKLGARLVFRDPRRFCGLTPFRSLVELSQSWSRLGPDALDVTAIALQQALAGRKRPIKSALLDQGVVAGVGNIYADESLFGTGIHPLRSAASLRTDEVERLAASIRSILSRASDRGGSTLRDYRDAFGQPGDAVQLHQVYGREGEPCVRCSSVLQGIRLQGRATVFCSTCQHLSTRRTGISRSAKQGPTRATKRARSARGSV
jgi:formamidopyrimidine-DNA glycosylase